MDEKEQENTGDGTKVGKKTKWFR